MTTIGVMGAKGSFTEEAGVHYAKKIAKTKDYSIEYLITSEAVFQALDAKKIDIGILALENSTMGVVLSTIQSMAKHVFTIKSIFSIDVQQCLLVQKGMMRKEIKLIVSMEPALLQCKKYLKKHWPKTKLQDYSDTAKAAEDLAEDRLLHGAAVIASRQAAKAYKLAVIEESIQDLKSNFTSFIAVTRR